jgi:hypothetical protein
LDISPLGQGNMTVRRWKWEMMLLSAFCTSQRVAGMVKRYVQGYILHLKISSMPHLKVQGVAR